MAITEEDDYILWTVTNADTANAGLGECELQYIVDDVVVKSKIWKTRVIAALEEAGEAPDPESGWVAELLASIKDTLAEAKESGEFDGVGIASIEQTETSTESNGANVLTITLTNGTEATFTVRNGAQGETGKSAYEYATDGGYTGTEDEFAELIANNSITIAKIWDIVTEDATASGATVEVDDSVDYPLNSLTLYGQSTQDGTPTPDSPIEIISAADSGSITVTLSDGGSQSQTLTLTAANGLPGIPVSSGGNYTDENGQEWVADEIVLNKDGSGVYVRNINPLEFNGTESWSSGFWPAFYTYKLADTPQGHDGFSNYFMAAESISNLSASERYGVFFLDADTMRIGFGYDSNYDVDNYKEWLAECYEKGEPLKAYYILAEPVETELSADEISAFLSLHTYTGTTIVSNDADAYMDVGYKKTK